MEGPNINLSHSPLGFYERPKPLSIHGKYDVSWWECLSDSVHESAVVGSLEGAVERKDVERHACCSGPYLAQEYGMEIGGEDVCMELLDSWLLVRHRSMRVPPVSSTAALVLIRRRGRPLLWGCCCNICFKGEMGNGDGHDGLARSVCSFVCHPRTILTTGWPSIADIIH